MFKPLLCLLLFLQSSSSLFAVQDSSKPNLVFIIADDCTYLDMEVHGGQAKTPHLKNFAANGIQFSRCFQAAAMCSPTRHNLYTGIYPVKSGAWPNHTRVYPGTQTLVHYLQAADYRVALSGKTHIAPRESFPFEYSNDFKSNDPSLEKPYPAIDKLISESTEKGNPFCLIACSNEPHSPYDKGDASAYPPESLKLPPSWVDTPATRRAYSKYLAEITYYDAQCGALLKTLDRHGVRDNTLVIIVSEQGSGFPFAKWTCYELGLASAMIAQWPGKITPGTTTDALVEYTDLAPTFLHAAGLPTPATMDGKSFLPVLLDPEKEHKKYTFGLHTTRGIKNGSDHYAIRSCGTKTHRYIRNLHHDQTFKNIVMQTGGDAGADFWASWLKRAEKHPHAASLVKKYQHRPAEELYHVATDPHCLHNLIDDPKLASLKDELSAQLDTWMKSQGDQGHQTEHSASTRQARPKKKKP